MLDEQKLTCRKCGVVSFVSPEKRKRPDELCSDCRAKPRKKIHYGLAKPCLCWHGDFDEFDNPVLDGVLFMPGKRTCGHSDCVEITHLLSEI